jgi:hypothetical protein
MGALAVTKTKQNWPAAKKEYSEWNGMVQEEKHVLGG